MSQCWYTEYHSHQSKDCLFFYRFIGIKYLSHLFPVLVFFNMNCMSNSYQEKGWSDLQHIGCMIICPYFFGKKG